MSNVCKFFQTNSCRYGNKCRFRHVYEDQQYYDTRSKPTGTSILKSNSLTKTNYYPQNNDQVDLKRFTEEVALSVKTIEEQGIWPISCFACLPAYGNLDGFEDVSPEELRWRAYEARATGKFTVYIEETQVLLKKAAAVRSVFIGKGPTASSILKQYIIDGSKRESSSSNTASNVSMFTTPVFNVQQNPFGLNTQSDFGAQQSSAAFNTNIFAQALSENRNEMPGNIFGQSIQQNIFGQAIVGAQETMASPFLQKQPDSGTVFQQNIFGGALQHPQPSTPANFFQPQSQSNTVPFFQPSFPAQSNSKQVSVNVLYSQIENLSPEELEQYKATTFTYGKTPLKPPPKELC